jgi:type IV pilus assembly protein PilQ
MSGQFRGDPITINLVNADIQSVFRFIGEHAQLNVVAGDDVKGTVTLHLKQVPWDQGFAAILHSKGLGCQQFGNIVRVAPLETMKAEQTSALEAKRAAEELQELELIVIPINYGQADDLKEQVKGVLSDRGSVEVDTRSNQLIVRESHDKVGQVRELVRQLDKQTPQVLIECRIVEANSSYSRGLGIQWGGELDASASSGFSTGMFFPNSVGTMGGLSADGDGERLFYSADTDNLLADLGSPVGESAALAISLGSVTGLLDLDVRLSAMEQEGWGKIVSQPRVLTLDNETATINQGSKIPYLSTSASGTNVEFVNATLSLTVTPHITSDDRVFLDIKLENNRADFSNTIQGQPAISVKEATTSLLVKNGDTTVIGGVFSTENTWQQSRIPFLSKIPLLGYLFKNSGEGTSRNELLVFITPRIVSRAQAS